MVDLIQARDRRFCRARPGVDKDLLRRESTNASVNVANFNRVRFNESASAKNEVQG
jgi:hypothetical protein